MKNNNKSVLYALSAVIFWSTVATAFKLTLEGMSFAQMLFYSSFFSFLSISIIMGFEGKLRYKNLFASKSIKNFALLGLLNPFLYYLVLFKAYSLLPAQEAQPLNYTWPIAISIFSVMFLKEKASVSTVFGHIIAFFGVVVIATRGDIFSLQFHNLYGVILAAGSSLIWAGFWTIKMLFREEDSLKLLGSFFFGSVYSLLYLLITGDFVIPGINYLAGTAYIGFFEMGITFFLWTKGMSLSTNKPKTSTLAYFSPFISFMFIALILGEKIMLSSIIGLLLIIAGILTQNLKKLFTKKVRPA